MSGSVSGYTIAANGTQTLGGVAGNSTGPIDGNCDARQAYLYALDSYAGKQTGRLRHSIGTTRGLTAATTNVSGLAVGSIGLAVR